MEEIEQSQPQGSSNDSRVAAVNHHAMPAEVTDSPSATDDQPVLAVSETERRSMAIRAVTGPIVSFPTGRRDVNETYGEVFGPHAYFPLA